jgi:hypothetical protein
MGYYPAGWFRSAPTGREFVSRFKSQGCALLALGYFHLLLPGEDFVDRLAKNA